jgi:hypothetical protein
LPHSVASLLAICVGGFLAASMLCGTATSLPEMVGYRFLQGAFGASMAPLGQALVMDSFPREKHGQVLSLWGVGAMLGPILGPTLGGYLTEALNWRWVFYINVPICAVALLGIWSVSFKSKAPARCPSTCSTSRCSASRWVPVQLMLDRGHSLNWFSSWKSSSRQRGEPLLLCSLSTCSRGAFIEPRLFKDRPRRGAGADCRIAVVMMAQMALLPSFLQQLMHRSTPSYDADAARTGVDDRGADLAPDRSRRPARDDDLAWWDSGCRLTNVDHPTCTWTTSRSCALVSCGASAWPSWCRPCRSPHSRPWRRSARVPRCSLIPTSAAIVGVSVLFTGWPR